MEETAARIPDVMPLPPLKKKIDDLVWEEVRDYL